MQYYRFIVVLLGSAFLFNSCAYTQDRHTFKKGETLERVSHRYQITKKRLAELNRLEDLLKFLPKEARINLTPERGPLKDKFSFYIKKAVYTPAARFVWPVIGKLSSKFGYRWGTLHNGIDISAPFGTPIRAAKAGEVIHSSRVAGYGNLVIVYHGGGYSTIYAHASKLLVKKGMRVQRGNEIAQVGVSGRATGPHLHFEVRKFKEPLNPLHVLP